MNLKPEYRKIVNEVVKAGEWTTGGQASADLREVAIKCQALADKPPKELTDEELVVIYATQPQGTKFPYARAAIAAHIAKQREPVTVKIRAAKCGDGVPYIVNETFQLCPTERWASDVVEVTLYPGE